MNKLHVMGIVIILLLGSISVFVGIPYYKSYKAEQAIEVRLSRIGMVDSLVTTVAAFCGAAKANKDSLVSYSLRHQGSYSEVYIVDQVGGEISTVNNKWSLSIPDSIRVYITKYKVQVSDLVTHHESPEYEY